jgi:signal transduction histidine kinase
MSRFSFLQLILCILLSGAAVAQRNQPLLELSDHFEMVDADSLLLVWRTPDYSKVTEDQVIDSFRAFRYTRFSHIEQLGPKLNRNNHVFWLALLVQNNTDDSVGLLLQGSYGPKIAFHSQDNYGVAIKGMSGVSARYDPNNIISLRYRNAFTFKVKEHSTDTVFFKIIDASLHHDFGIQVFEAGYFDRVLNRQLNSPTLYNGWFLGFLFPLLIASFCFYWLMRQAFILWYISYLVLLIIYYWRDFETWNNYFEFSHRYLSWDHTKVVLGYLIFLSYSYFMTEILGLSERYPFAKKWLRWVTLAFPFILLFDILCRIYFPYGSYILMYSSGVIAGVIQISLLIPLFTEKGKADRILKIISVGSILLFMGWLSILVLPIAIHRIILRITTLVELTIFMIAMAERIIQIYKNQQKEILEKEHAVREERDRIAAEMHDDLGGGLTAIRYLSMQGKSGSKDKDPKEIFSKISEMSNDITSKISEIVWVLNEKNDTLDQLIYYIRIKVHDQLDLHRIQFEFNQSIMSASLEISSEFRRDILLCISESINNVIKHAEATLVIMQINQDDIALRISIQDDGIFPIDINTSKKGNGLTNMKNRISRWNGTIAWQSANGTKVEFSIPVASIRNRLLTKVI